MAYVVMANGIFFELTYVVMARVKLWRDTVMAYVGMVHRAVLPPAEDSLDRGCCTIRRGSAERIFSFLFFFQVSSEHADGKRRGPASIRRHPKGRVPPEGLFDAALPMRSSPSCGRRRHAAEKSG